MIVASIDIGTNTVLLLIADVVKSSGRITPLVNKYRMPRIGNGTKLTGVISKDRIEELLAVLRKYQKLIKEYRCERVIVTGTNAFRIAKNTREIANEIKSEFDFNLQVISGEEEAEYAYYGAISGLSNSSDATIIDIGGSSTEIISGNDGKILSKTSLQLGSVTATEQLLKSIPPTSAEIEKLNQEILNQFSQLNKQILSKNVIAIAGTATTLACMLLGLKNFDEEKVDNSRLSLHDLNKVIEQLSTLKPSEILQRYGSVMEGREDIIFAGAYILLRFMEYIAVENILVSTRGIRYGAIVKHLQNLN
jgi:exopolyphosphatase / guanosine-5'-triphosphate,3'-diphosphate pyrophosphatase